MGKAKKNTTNTFYCSIYTRGVMALRLFIDVLTYLYLFYSFNEPLFPFSPHMFMLPFHSPGEALCYSAVNNHFFLKPLHAVKPSAQDQCYCTSEQTFHVSH